MGIEPYSEFLTTKKHVIVALSKHTVVHTGCQLQRHTVVVARMCTEWQQNRLCRWHPVRTSLKDYNYNPFNILDQLRTVEIVFFGGTFLWIWHLVKLNFFFVQSGLGGCDTFFRSKLGWNCPGKHETYCAFSVKYWFWLTIISLT